MSVLFKNGKFSEKRYDKLCPDQLVYLKVGQYCLNLEESELVYLDDPSFDPIDIEEFGPLPFYIALDVDFGRDQKINLILDRRGRFIRKDHGIFAAVPIETLFHNNTK